MSLPTVNSANIATFLNKAEIVQETCEQIMKDFASCGLNISFSGDTENAYQELHEQISKQMLQLANTDYPRLLSVLYRVDISEKDIFATEVELPHYSHTQVLAHQIMVRELKKILTRRYYKAANES